MKKIVGYVDSINECDCCGRVDLKGTYCVEIDGEQLNYGSTCAFKVHGITEDEQKEMKKTFKKRMRASEKFKVMESEYNGTEIALVKMFRFVEGHNLDIINFINKWGKKVEETDTYIAYAIGYIVKIINKSDV